MLIRLGEGISGEGIWYGLSSWFRAVEVFVCSFVRRDFITCERRMVCIVTGADRQMLGRRDVDGFRRTRKGRKCKKECDGEWFLSGSLTEETFASGFIGSCLLVRKFAR